MVQHIPVHTVHTYLAIHTYSRYWCRLYVHEWVDQRIEVVWRLGRLVLSWVATSPIGLMELQYQEDHARSLVGAILLNKCVKAKLWENTKHVAKQLDKIGMSQSGVTYWCPGHLVCVCSSLRCDPLHCPGQCWDDHFSEHFRCQPTGAGAGELIAVIPSSGVCT